MNTKFLVAAALAVSGLTATSALASTVITQNGETVTIDAVAEPFSTGLKPAGFTMIDDFNSPVAAGFSVSGGNIIPYPGNPSHDAEPPGDTTAFESVEASNNPFTITDNAGALTAVSFYMGSPDSYNGINLTITGNLGPVVLSGSQIWGGGTPAGGYGNQSDGYLVTYSFSPNDVHSLTFTSSQLSFEFDNLSGVSVPEPASWALMIMGFGAAGAVMRRRRTALA